MEIRPECQHYSWKIVKLEARARTWVALAAEGGERKGIIRRRGYPSLISGERASERAEVLQLDFWRVRAGDAILPKWA